MTQPNPDERRLETEFEESVRADLEQAIETPGVHDSLSDEWIDARIATGIALGIISVGGAIVWKKHRRNRQE